MKKAVLKLLPVGLALVLSLGALFATTLAWFSMNKEVDSDSMKLKVDVMPNLVIELSSSALADIDELEAQRNSAYYRVDIAEYEGITDSSGVVINSAAIKALVPTTHSSSGINGLVYVTNPEVVGRTTGLATGSSALTYASAVNSSAGAYPQYYIDRTVYIATTKSDLAVTSVNATLTGEIDSVDPNAVDTLNAASIDFYVSTDGTLGEYKGTLNVAGLDAEVNDCSTAKTSVALMDAGTVPHNTEGYLKIVMRCYIDGELLKSSGVAYINSAMFDISIITLNVKIAAVTPNP